MNKRKAQFIKMGRIRTVGQLDLNATPNQLESHLGCLLPIKIDSKVHVV